MTDVDNRNNSWAPDFFTFKKIHFIHPTYDGFCVQSIPIGENSVVAEQDKVRHNAMYEGQHPPHIFHRHRVQDLQSDIFSQQVARCSERGKGARCLSFHVQLTHDNAKWNCTYIFKTNKFIFSSEVHS